jgi:hypothetical protein
MDPNSLVELNFAHVEDLTNMMVRDIWCSFPRLERFKGDYIMAKHIIQGGLWVCEQLRELELEIQFRIFDKYLQPMIFQVLLKLVRLEKLKIGCGEIYKPNPELNF